MNRRRLLRTCALALTICLLIPAAGKAQWRKLSNVFPGTFFNEVFFIDANHGWLCQHLGIVVRTIDGGTSWQTANLPGSTGSFNRDICFVDILHGFVSGDDGIWRTNDGGVSWTNVTPPGMVTGNSSNWFIDQNNGVYGFGPCNTDTVRFFRTTNGGATWDSVKYAHPVDVAVGGICYANGAYYAGGGVGKVWKSTDNGVSWVYGSTNSGGFHEDAVAAPGGTIHMPSVDGSVCGVSGSSKMVRSTDAGTTWSSVIFPGVIMWGVSFYTPSEGWCCADNGHAWYTNNAGVSWTEKSCGMNRADRIDDIHFTDATHGWAVGDGIYKYVSDGYNARPDTINFGDIIVGQTSADSQAIISALGSSLTVTNRVIAGLNPLEFQSAAPLGSPMTIASCTDGGTLVHFRPTSEGPKIARLEFTISGYPETPVVYLMGRGVKPRIFTAPGLVFDTMMCDVRILDTLWIHNTGTAPLRITGATTTAPASSSFQVLSPTMPATIPAGDSVRCIIQMSTTSFGPISGTVSFISNDPDPGKSPWDVVVRGYRRQILAGFEGDSLLVIPGALIGMKGSTCIHYMNLGDGEQVIEEVVPTSTDPTIKQEPTTVGIHVMRGGLQYLCFTATASDTLVHTRRFRIRTDPCGLDTFLTVRYQAVTPVITSASTLTLVSGACDSNAVDTILLRNVGRAPLVVKQPSWSGRDIGSFEVIAPTTWPDTIPVGGVLPVAVRSLLVPGGPSPATASLTFPNSDLLPGKNQWKVDLTAQRGSSELAIAKHQIDVGTVCVGDSSHVERVPLHNVGNAPAVVRSVTPLVRVDAVRLASAPATVGPNAVDSVAFAIAPLVSGAFSVQYVIQYDPCDRLDTITITGNAVDIELQATPAAVSFGSAQKGKPVQRTFTLSNNGSTTATITTWSFVPQIAAPRVTAPSTLPLVLPPGASRQITVELTPADTGSYQLALVSLGEGACPDTISTPLTLVAVSGAVLVDRLNVDLGHSLACDAAALIDSVVLTNSGNAPVKVTDLQLMKGVDFTITPKPSLPLDLPPGSTLMIPIELRGGASGSVNDDLVITLDQSEQPEIRIPLAAQRDRAALALLDSSGADAVGVSFGTLTRCNASAARTMRLVNRGTVPDTVTVGASNAPFTVDQTTQVILAPGEERTVTITAAMAAAGAANGTLDILWAPCGLEQHLPLDASYQDVATVMADVTFDPVVLTKSDERQTKLENTGAVDQVVDHIALQNASADLTLVGIYDGLLIQAGGSLPVTVHYAPSAVGAATARIVAVMRSPCADTIAAQVSAMGTRDQIDTIALRGGDARGRWGTHVAIPIAFENRGGAWIGSMEWTVTAAQALLDPVDVRFAAGGQTAGWKVERIGYDATSGTLRLRLTAEQTAAPLPTSDSLLVVEYNVLRGDAVASDVDVHAAVLPANIIAIVEKGAFALEDYCDAYGRLLRTSGNVALDQNVPNPFNPETIIEFETAFRGPVLLAVYDGAGREVARLVDEELPAGRRRLHFDARALPSGVYTYKLVTGLQVLMRRMVVTK